ncbi:MAG: helix-turn-helix transcriptional regulator [Bacteroidales bacterium]|nr:helix-turn-helix transcriptional regulator [Bacteroidales bacterium]
MQAFSFDLLLYFISDGCYATPGIPPELLLYARLLMLGSAPCLIPILWLYFDRLIFRRRFRSSQFIWILAPVALLISGIVLTEICDKPVVADFLLRLYREGTSVAAEYKGSILWHYYIWTSLFFRIVIGTEFIVAAFALVRFVIRQKFNLRNVWNYLFNGSSLRIIELQTLNLVLPMLFVGLKLVFLKSFLDTHIWFSIFLAVVVTVGYSSLMVGSLFGEKNAITRIQAKHVMFFNYNKKIKGPIVEIMMEELLDEAEQDALLRFKEKIGENLHISATSPKELTAVKEQLFSTVAGTWDDSLLAKFQALMLNEQLFLQPSLTLADVADRLHTNKTYVSKMVNNTYNLGFPELLNTLRVDYAEQYLLSHRDAKQEEVARACGFLSASSFNNIFKKITGVTPKVWLVGMGNKRG